MIRRAEERWGSGIVEQVSLDLKAAFPKAKGFSTTNLWYMKKWYQFYSDTVNENKLQQLVGELSNSASPKLRQIAAAAKEEKLQMK